MGLPGQHAAWATYWMDSGIGATYWMDSGIVSASCKRGPILESHVYTADIVAIQETRLERSWCVAHDLFQSLLQLVHLGMAVLMWDTIVALEVDMTRWDSDEMQLQAIKIQSDHTFLLVNVYACSNSIESQK